MKRFTHSKKGFDANQIFIFVTAVVVVGFVMLFGAQVLSNFGHTQDDIENLQLKRDLEQLIKVVKNDHGSQKFFESRLPNEFTHICFFDTKSATTTGGECPEALRNVTASACPFWVQSVEDISAQKKNVVLVRADKTVATPLYIEGIRLETPAGDTDAQVLCVESRLVELRLRGERSQVYISAAPPRTN